MEKYAELKELLENVSGSYWDFVAGTLADAEDFNAYDKIIAFIRENPDADTSDICFFNLTEIQGLEAEYDEEGQNDE